MTFAAVVGMDLARQALLLLAIDPGLKGVLIAAGRGSGKSLLARSFASLLADAPFLELPAAIAEDHLLGSLDLEQTIRSGRPRIAPGLLARVHGGVLHADEVNLLEPEFARHVALALRSGVSAGFPADFALIGTYDPDEGEVSAALAGSVGMHVAESGCSPCEERIEILRRAQADPLVLQQFASETTLIKQCIAQARSRLPKIEATLDERRRLSAEAVRLGVEGNRADIFALGAARAHAALMGRISLHEDDLRVAVRLVLLPRAGLVEQPRPAVPASATRRGEAAAGPPEDTVIKAIDSEVAQDILTPPHRSAPRGPRPRSGRRARDSSKKTCWDRGRCVRAVAARPHASRIALAATLRAAAVSKAQQPPIRVTPGDLRFKQFKQTRGMLIIFAVDASGSMAVNRIHQAKGAVIRLLGKAYLHRDEVALIGFRGTRAEVLLPPSRSVELAKRALDALPVGGGTPMAAGLAAALGLARHPRTAAREKLLVLVTDGRANAGLGSREAVWREIEQVCAVLQAERVNSVVIDTTNPVVSDGDAGRIAGLLGGRLVCLPRPDADAVCEAVAAATGRSR